jgi:DNA (cytosine-5)-methyltransferase 1
VKTFGTVCSGIGAPEVAFARLGWRSLFCAEIEKFPCAVLAHHFPNTPNYGDLTKFHEWPHSNPDVLCAGTPCQSFSVAGLRAGMDDPRGNLALVFLGVVDRLRPRWVLWENVPGVHSSWSDETESAPSEESRRLLTADGLDARDFVEVEQTSDFDCFAAALAELGYGVATRIFDAQFFGLAQRRERVFVVGHIGGQWQRAAAVLFDRAGLCGDPAPGRETGQGTAPTISARTQGGGGLGTDFDLDGGIIRVSPPISGCSNGGGPNGPGRTADDCEALIPISHSLKADGFDASEDGTGRGVPLVPTVISSGQGNAERVSDGSPSLTCLHEAPILFDPVAFNCKDHGADAGALSPTLRGSGHDGSHANGGAPPAIAIQEIGKLSGVRDQNGSSIANPGDPMFTLQSGAQHGVAVPESAIAFKPCFTRSNKCSGNPEEICHTMSASPKQGDTSPHVAYGMAVRRLTPRECERLQGFQDDFTLVEFRGKPAADGPRYKAIGNSMAVPCIAWIGRRMDLVDELVPFSVDTPKGKA